MKKKLNITVLLPGILLILFLAELIVFFLLRQSVSEVLSVDLSQVLSVNPIIVLILFKLLEITIIVLFLFCLYRRYRKSVNAEVYSLQKDLLESESRFRSLVTNVPGVTFRCSCENWKMTFISNELEHLSGYEARLFLGDDALPYESIMYRDDIQMLRDAINDAVRKKENFNVEYRIIHKNGTLKWVYEKGLGVFDEQDRLLYLDGVIVDITDLKKTQQEMSFLKSYLQNIIDSMPSAIIGINPVGIITHWNSKTTELTGLSSDSAVGKQLLNVFPRLDAVADYIQAAIEGKQQITVPRHTYEENKVIHYEEITVYPLASNEMEGAVIRIDDVTEKHKLEEIVVQSDKMLSIGGLAAGMAHELNNPLAGMMQTAGVMAKRLGKNLNNPASAEAAGKSGITLDAVRSFMDSRDIFKMLDTIDQSGRRMAVIINDMLGFSRQSQNIRTSQNLVEIIDKSLTLAEKDFDLKKEYDFKKIRIIRDFEKSLPQVYCDAAKIQQVILNLLRNSAQAMQEEGTENPQIIIRIYYKAEKAEICIEIRDNGPGMSENIRKRIFEPFFTTKPEGLGTGLGLSVSYFIITENHCGEMSVESSPGRGTKFIIRLPVTAE